MNRINILVSGAGAPGIVGTIYSLRNNSDNRPVKIFTTDIKNEVVGKYLSDEFFVIPRALEEEKYLQVVLDICKKKNIDVFIPQNTSELLILSKEIKLFEKIGSKIIISDYPQMIVANDKSYLLKKCCHLGIPYPEFYLVDNFYDLTKAAELLGYPNRPTLVKPPNSNGSRGIRIIDENRNYNQLFYNEKPTSLFVKLKHLYDLIGEKFNPLLVMEFLPGEEITIDVFRDQNVFVSIPRKREEVKSGISFINSAYKSDELIEYSKILSDKLDLKYCFGYQFKINCNGIPKIIECNPRVQGTMIYSTFMGFNMIYASVKSALGEKIADFVLDWETKLLRYWGALGINQNGVYKI